MRTTKEGFTILHEGDENQTLSYRGYEFRWIGVGAAGYYEGNRFLARDGKKVKEILDSRPIVKTTQELLDELSQAREWLDNLSAALETVLVHYGHLMTEADLRQRSQLVATVRARLWFPRDESEDIPEEEEGDDE